MADKKKNASQTTEPKVRSSEKEKGQVPSAKAVARDERKEQESKPVNKSARRETKASASWQLRLRNSTIGRFVFDDYYELRHKVTWPNFEEARNMTLIVILLSAAVGAVLSLADLGLVRLFFLINGR